MRVILVAKPWKGGLARYLFEALRGLSGHEVRWIPTAPVSALDRWRYRIDRVTWRKRQRDRINETARDAAVFLNLPPDPHLIASHPGNLLWMTDSARAERTDLAAYAKVFTSDSGYAPALATRTGAERFAGVLPFAMSPHVHHCELARAPSRDVCFIGNRDRKRDAHILALLASPFSATVFGNYFGRGAVFWRSPASFRPRVAIESMAAIYARHRISLNVHAEVVAHGTNMRTFECAGYQIPQLVESRPGLPELFEPHREIATYAEPDELQEALARLLADPQGAARMAARAHDRAVQEHTYTQRVRRMLEALR